MASIIMKPYHRRPEPSILMRLILGTILVAVAMLYGVMAAVFPPSLMFFPAAPLLVMVALILWILPEIGGIEYDRLQTIMLVYLVLAIIWPNYVAFNLPGLPWISLTRIALLVAVAIFAYNFSTSLEMRDKLRDSVSVMPLTKRFFWLFWLTGTISLAFSNDVLVSVKEYINNQIYWTMGLFLTAMLSTRPGFVMKVAKVIVISTSVVIVYSTYEYSVQRVFWIDYLPSFLKIDPDLLAKLLDAQSRAGTDIYRVRGPYVVALYFSEFLSMTYPFLLHFTFQQRRFLPFIALAAATFGCVVVMVFTDARSAMIGFILGSVLYIAYAALRWRVANQRSIMATAVLLAYPVMLFLLSLIVWFWHRAHVMVLGGGQHSASSEARDRQWEMAWPKLGTHPLGYGVGRGNEALGFVNPSGQPTVDSYFITVMMDSGLLALPFFILTFLIPAAVAFKYYRTSITPEEGLLAPLSLGLINFLVIKSVLTSETSVPLAFIYVGCIVGLVWQRKKDSELIKMAPVGPPEVARLICTVG